jgi:EpsI family protein
MKNLGKPFYIAIVVLLVGMFFVYRAPHGKSMPLQQELFTFEEQIGEWRGEEPRTLDQRVLDVLRADAYTDRIYRNKAGEWISFYVGYFEDQKSGETIHSPKNCMPGAGWNFVQSEEVAFTIEGGQYPPIQFRALKGILMSKEERLLSYYWYQSRGRFMTSEYWHKFYLILDAIRYNRSDGALVRVLAPLPKNADVNKVDTQLKEFIIKAAPILQYEYFPTPASS